MKSGTAAALLALIVLAACAPEVESTIRVSEIDKVVESGTALSVPALLRIPQGSEDTCNEELAQLIENLSTIAPVTGKGTCIESDGDNLAEIETEMVIATPDAAFDARNLLLLTATPDGDGAIYALTFSLTRPMADVIKVLATDSDQLSVEFDPAKFTFTMTNDQEYDVFLRGQTVFFDTRPALPAMEPQVIPQNSSIEVVFSDVASVFTEDGDAYHFASLYFPP